VNDRPPDRRRAGLALALSGMAVCLAAGGCGVSGLAFTVDHRVSFVSPLSRALVSVPVTLRWTGAPASAGGGTFAVFVDRAPVRPGQTLRAVVGRDTACLHTAGCPGAAYLAERGVYTTTGNSLSLQVIRPLNHYQRVQLHEATLIVLDAAGRRQGELAWYIDFRIDEGSLY